MAEALAEVLTQFELEGELISAFIKNGMNGVVEVVHIALDSWKNQLVNIAVTGRSGVGKSSLINALIGLDADDIDAAPVGVVETTCNVKAYQHPKHKNLVFYDLPGVGTRKFPRETYFVDVEFEKYDFFIIVSADRFSEDDAWLGQEIRKTNKSFVYVRTKIDIDLMNERRTRKKLLDIDPRAAENETIEKIRQNCLHNLDFVCPEVNLYLVDSYDTKSFEFNDLVRYMIDAFPSTKRNALILALSLTTSTLIDEKERVLADRIFKIGLVSAVGGTIPIPGVSAAVDLALIMKELSFYQSQFRNVEASEMIKMRIAVPVNLMLSSFSAHITKAALSALLKGALFSEIIENTVTLAVPILGSIVGGVMSLASTTKILKFILNKVVNDARKINLFLRDYEWDETRDVDRKKVKRALVRGDGQEVQKPERHTHEFCMSMYEQTDIYTPTTWTAYTNEKSVKQWKVDESGPCGNNGYTLVDVDKDTFTAIERLVHGTWEPSKVGLGKDAKGLRDLEYTRLKITKIQRVENLTLYEKYINMQQGIFHKAGEGPMIKQLSTVDGCRLGQPKTEQFLNTTMKEHFYDEVNETYLFHGTKSDIVETLQKQGMDPRVGKGMLGGGIYMAESSTKSDQYTDEKPSRRSKDLQMFLVRASLGNIYVMNTVKQLCRPPCTESSCLSDKCFHDEHFDSVVADGDFIFREFVVYDASLAYPEYVITYDRV